ncbi:[protein-PII] uridylyltransferase [Thermodesulfobacteriota bacterium]
MVSTKSIVRDFLESREALVKGGLDQGSGLSATRRYTKLMDRFVRGLFYAGGSRQKVKEIQTGRLVVCALGSYGRRELCLESDVDLLVIHQGKLSTQSRQIITQTLYPLWDAKLEVGHSVLTVQECIRIALEDFRFLTALMDARYLLGSRGFFKLFQEAFWSRIDRGKKPLLKEFLLYQERRLEKYGGQSYFMEPDVKEGLGGLRDLHFMGWLSRLYFRAEQFSHIRRFEVFAHFEIEKLNNSKSFLLKVRNHLHHLAGRRDDRLLLSLQKDLAEVLGYQDSVQISGAARFMRQYYRHMNRIRYGYEEFQMKAMDTIDPRPFETSPERLPKEFHIMKGNLVLQTGYFLHEDPLLILGALHQANKRNLFLGSGFIWEAKKRIAVEGDEIAAMPGAKALFVDLILHPRNPKIMRLALEIGLMDLFIPEFKKIRNLAQFSYYHEETVDLHSLRTMEVIHDISMGAYDDTWRILNEVFQELLHQDWLFLAGLLHDIGKGYRGDHSVKGAVLIPRILKRLGIGGSALPGVSFLVQHHLLLVNASQRRDLNEEKTAVQVAQTLQSVEKLRLLLLLTVADSMATGAMARSDWKISLLIELYFKVKNILDRGRLASPDATKRLEEKKGRLVEILSSHYAKGKIRDLMDQVSARYFLNTPLEDMGKHFHQALSMGEGKLSWYLEKKKKVQVTKVILCTHDQPGLFSKMVGVFTLNNLKVLSANIFTLKNGLAFDSYEVTNPVDPFREEEMWQKVKVDAVRALEGKIPLDDLIMKKEQKDHFLKKKYLDQPKRVAIDNRASDFFTIIEMGGGNRTGLLYDMAKAIYSQGLDIRFAKVDTDEEKTRGVFYIRDSSGQKVYEEAMIEEIKKRILAAIEQ